MIGSRRIIVSNVGKKEFRKITRLTRFENVIKPQRSMILSESTYQRLKRNSSWYGDSESFEEILIRLMDFYEKNNSMKFDYPQ